MKLTIIFPEVIFIDKKIESLYELFETIATAFAVEFLGQFLLIVKSSFFLLNELQSELTIKLERGTKVAINIRFHYQPND